MQYEIFESKGESHWLYCIDESTDIIIDLEMLSNSSKQLYNQKECKLEQA